MVVKYNFPSHRRGDTFLGVDFELIQNDLPIDLTGSTIRSQFRPGKSMGSVGLEFSTADSTITIMGAGNNIIHFVSRTGEEMDIEPGIYLYDIEIRFPNSTVQTLIEGSLSIINSITK